MGSRDSFGTKQEIAAIIKKLKFPAKLHAIENGDHSLKVPKKAGVLQEDVYNNAMDAIVDWIKTTATT